MSDNIKVTGGEMTFAHLDNTLSAEDYAYNKAMVWLSMMRKGRIPEKWSKPTASGTSVGFYLIDEDASVSEKEEAENRFQRFIDDVNERFNLGLVLTFNESGDNDED